MAAIADRVATVVAPSALVDRGGDASLDLPLQLAQMAYTLTAIPSIDQVLFRFHGGPPPVEVAGIDLTEAVDRDDFAAQTPPILIESPTVGTTVSSPLRVRGSANAVEGSFRLQVEQTVDGQDDILAERQVQTPGSGTRGEFDVSVDLPPDAAGPATLVTYQIARSAAGDVIDRAKIPIVLSP